MNRADKLRGIYAIVQDGLPGAVTLARAALESGIRIVQYRAKDGIVPSHARELRALTRMHDALLIINDDWTAVPAFDADGVHVGPEDASLARLHDLRRQLHGRLLGFSAATPDEAKAAEGAGADYLGVGSVYATASKDDAGAPIGIAGLRMVAAATAVPVAAIGGISARNLAAVRESGVAMAAVLSALAGADDPHEAAAVLVRTWNAP